MGIGSISFWQQDQSFWNQGQSFAAQDQNYWSQQQAASQALSADASLISSMGAARTNEASGLAQIAVQAAKTRVNNQIAALEKALAGATPAAPTGPAPATATGTVPLTTGTSLFTLGIPPNGTITVSDGTNTTSYSSTGADTVANLIGAINTGNAYVMASLNSQGKLVITGKNDTESVTVGGTFASDIGFGPGHQTFQPTAASPAASSSSKATTSSASTSKTASKSTTAVPTLASENASSAATMLSDSGVSGSLVDMLV